MNQLYPICPGWGTSNHLHVPCSWHVAQCSLTEGYRQLLSSVGSAGSCQTISKQSLSPQIAQVPQPTHSPAWVLGQTQVPKGYFPLTWLGRIPSPLLPLKVTIWLPKWLIKSNFAAKPVQIRVRTCCLSVPRWDAHENNPGGDDADNHCQKDTCSASTRATFPSGNGERTLLQHLNFREKMHIKESSRVHGFNWY